MWELIGRAAVAAVVMVAVFYAVVVGSLLRGGGLEEVPRAMARGAVAAVLCLALFLLLTGCASAPVPPEVQARGAALLLELRAMEEECCCER